MNVSGLLSYSNCFNIFCILFQLFSIQMWYHGIMFKKQMKIRIHPQKHKRLKILASKQSKSLNLVAEIALDMYLAKYESIDFERILDEKT